VTLVTLLISTVRKIYKVFRNYTAVSKIYDGLYVGDISLAENRNIAIVNNIDFVMDARYNFMDKDGDWEIVWERLEKFTDGIVHLLKLGYSVAVFCYGGIDRSPFVTAVVVSKHHNISLPEAYKLVLEKRPQAFWHYEWEREYTEKFKYS